MSRSTRDTIPDGGVAAPPMSKAMEAMYTERFWSRVAKGDGADDCWLWTGGMIVGGYGTFAIRGRTVSAHRVAWMVCRGTIPDGMQVLHRCDNPPCVRPEHLFLGTHRDNMEDKAIKGRALPKAERARLAGMGAKRPAILFHCSEEERDEIQAAAVKMHTTVTQLIRDAVLGVIRGGGMALPPDLARMVRAEAKRRKLEPETLLAMWIGAAAGKEEK